MQSARPAEQRWYRMQRWRAWAPLLAWTVFVWVSRVRNVWRDEELTTNGQLLRTGYAAVFLVLAGAAWLVLRRAPRSRPVAGVDRRLLVAFLAWTVGFWLVRGIGIIVDDHDTGFTVVHTVLMAVSIALAGIAARSLARNDR